MFSYVSCSHEQQANNHYVSWNIRRAYDFLSVPCLVIVLLRLKQSSVRGCRIVHVFNPSWRPFQFFMRMMITDSGEQALILIWWLILSQSLITYRRVVAHDRLWQSPPGRIENIVPSPPPDHPQSPLWRGTAVLSAGSVQNFNYLYCTSFLNYLFFLIFSFSAVVE